MTNSLGVWDRFAAVAMGLFFLPPIIYAVCGPEFVWAGQMDLPYRISQALIAALILIAGIAYTVRAGATMSMRAAIIATFLVINLVAQLISFMFTFRSDFRIEGIQSSFIYLALLIGFDLVARRFTWERFCQYAAPLAIAMVVASWVNVTFFAERIFGRASFWEAHPNLGGEVMLAAVAIVAFTRNPLIRFIVYALAFSTLFQLQARAGMLGAIIMVIGVEAPFRPKVLRWGVIGSAIAAVVLGAWLMVSPSLASKASEFVANDILMLSDPYRGASSGLVGRDKVFIQALQEAADRPVFGKGVNQFPPEVEIQLHNGYLRILAETGFPGLIIIALIFYGLVESFKVSIARGSVVLAMCLVFFFNARSFSLNIYPLLLWLAILPWALRAPAAAQTVEPVEFLQPVRPGVS